jgi:hypothetical protein
LQERGLVLLRVKHGRGIVLVAFATALSAFLVIGLAAPPPGHARQRCTHGVSSIGPVTIEHGKIVGGDTTPQTEACLP